MRFIGLLAVHCMFIGCGDDPQAPVAGTRPEVTVGEVTLRIRTRLKDRRFTAQQLLSTK